MASMIAASASPGRDDARHLSPSKAAGLLHDQPYMKLRDQSPKPNGLVQPVVSYGGHGAVITTAGPKRTSSSRSTSPQQAPVSHPAAAMSPPHPFSDPTGDVRPTVNVDSPAKQQQLQHQTPQNHGAAAEPAGDSAGATASAGKRAVRQLSTNDSFIRSQLAPKRQVLDHPTQDDDCSAQQQQQPSRLDDAGDTAMGEASDAKQWQQQQQQQNSLQKTTVSAAHCPVQSPFCSVPPSLQRHNSLDIDGRQQQQQQSPPDGMGRSGSSSVAAPPATAAAGRMLPPTSTGQRRLLLPRADSAASSAAAASSAFAATANTILAGEGDHSIDGVTAAAVELPKRQGMESPKREPSLSMDHILASKATISSAASLEGWLPNTSVGEAIAAAVAAAGGGPYPMLRSGSSASTATASMPRQGSLSFALPPHPPLQQQQQQHSGSRLGSAALESQGSFAGWPGSNAGATQGSAGSSSSTLNREGSFSWPRVQPAHNLSEDSLKLDIQVLSPVIPEEYPDEDPAAADGYLTQQQVLLAQLQAEREEQHMDRAFFAKVASWEQELVGMLEQQATPLAIRQIVAVFKDRINTERDKTEFKAICDKWTSVVEYPVGSGVKCLAVKSWMRGDL